MTHPQEPSEPREPKEPREPQAEEPEESEPQPERANKTMLRLIRALERGEPWAVKYCLSHLDDSRTPRVDRKARPAEPIHDRCARIIPSDAEPGGRYAKKSRGPEAVIAPPEMAEHTETRGFERLPPLAERAADLAGTYHDALMGKGPNPFDTADSDMTCSAAPTEIPAGEPG